MLRAILVACSVAAVLSIPLAQQQNDEVRLANGAKLTVSGLSAGAYMAQQIAVAYSANISGVAIFAGGPYFCSMGKEMLALTACMSTPAMVLPSVLVSSAKGFEKDGKIDSLANLQKQKVFLYSGKRDSVVKTGIVKKVEEFYSLLNASTSVSSEYSVDSEHGMPTLDYGNECTELGAPFVLKCNYDGAGVALRTLYGGKEIKPATAFAEENIMTLKQHAFVPKGGATVGLAEEARIYMPSGCKDGKKVCDIHVMFHGCKQTFAMAKGALTVHGGFDGYGEANDIIVVYPQAAKSLIKNPSSCFDWWGYSGSDFAFKSAAQMAMTMNMVDYLANGGR